MPPSSSLMKRHLLWLCVYVAMNVALADEGERLYQAHCAVCHGERGDGDSRAARSLKPPPRDFTQADPGTFTRERMIDAVAHGRPGTAMMPFASRLTPEQIEQVVDFVRRRFMPAKRGKGNGGSDDKKNGEALYRRHCAVCHGDDGAAAMWARNSFKPPPRDFTQADPGTLTRERMIDAVTHGRPGTAMMPFVSRLSPEEIERVVDFVRERFLGRARYEASLLRATVSARGYPGNLEGDPLRGEAIFQGQCYECHGRDGRGDGPRAHFIHPPPRDFTSTASRARFDRAHLYQAIERGKRGTVMPAWGKVLTPQQIADVAEYVFIRFIRPREGEAGGGDAREDVRGEDPEPELARGRRIYDFRCYFCHGYDGDAKTLAATFLDPPPVDFTAADPERLTVEAIVRVLREGRPGTAMQSFARVLEEADMRAVARFVHTRFVVAKAPAGDYHTAENGWPDHDRYRDAFPFALGEIPLDRPVDRLTPAQQRGRILYLRACISCHDRARVETEGVPWRSWAVSYPRAGYDHRAPDQVSGATPYAVHDRAPVLIDATPRERAGERLYQENCSFCHAADGSGRNWIGAFLEPPPRDLRDQTLARLTDDDLASRIAYGVPGSAMPAWGRVLTPAEIDSIVAYLRKAFFPSAR